MEPQIKQARHSVHELHYHLVLVTKYRKKVIDDTISRELQSDFERLAKSHEIALVEWNHDRDHIHAFFSASPTTSLAKFINAYKSATSRNIKKTHPEIKQHLWKEYVWSRSYYISTIGNTDMDTVTKYIQSQGE